MKSGKGGSDVKSTLLGNENERERDLTWELPILSANSATIEVSMKAPNIKDLRSNGISQTCLCFGILLILWIVAIVILVVLKLSVVAAVIFFISLFILALGAKIWRCGASTRRTDEFERKIKRNFKDCKHFENIRQISFTRLAGIIDYDKNKLHIYEFGLNGQLANAKEWNKKENIIKHQLLCIDISSLRSISCPGSESTLKTSGTWYDESYAKREDYRIELTYSYYNNLPNRTKTVTINRYSVTKSQTARFAKWLQAGLKHYGLIGLNNDNSHGSISIGNSGSIGSIGSIGGAYSHSSNVNARGNSMSAQQEARLKEAFGSRVRIIKSADELMDMLYDEKLKELQEMNDKLLFSNDLDTVNNAADLDYFLKKYPKQMAKEYVQIEKHCKDPKKDNKVDANFLTKVLIRKGQNWEKLANNIDQGSGEGQQEGNVQIVTHQ